MRACAEEYRCRREQAPWDASRAGAASISAAWSRSSRRDRAPRLARARAQPGRALHLRRPAGRRRLGPLASRCSVSVASMLAFNWFFLPPRHTFTLSDSENWFALAVYLTTAVVVSHLAAGAAAGARPREQRERESALLAELASELLAGRKLEDEVADIAERAAKVLGVESAVIELGPPGRTDRRRVAARARGLRAGHRHALHARGRRSRRGRPPPVPALRSQRSSRSPPSGSGSRTRRSRRRRCATATSSRPRSSVPSPTTCARR